MPGNASRSFCEAVLILILLPRNKPLDCREVKYYVDMIPALTDFAILTDSTSA